MTYKVVFQRACHCLFDLDYVMQSEFVRDFRVSKSAHILECDWVKQIIYSVRSTVSPPVSMGKGKIFFNLSIIYLLKGVLKLIWETHYYL